MKELTIINRVLCTFHLQNPIVQKVQKKIYRSKESTLGKILKSSEGLNSAEKNTAEIYLRNKSGSFSPYGGIMKKTYVVAASITAIIIGTGLFFALHSPNKNVTSLAGNKIAESASITFVVGDAKVKHENSDFTSLAQGDKLLKNDIVHTGKKSNVIVQVGDLGVMNILENTEFTFKELKENGSTEAYVSKGGVYSKIIKLEKEHSYRVKTPTAIAAVRGTQFLTQYSSSDGKDQKTTGKSEVQVLDGKVAVKTGETGEIEKIAEDGRGIDVNNGNLKAYKLSKKETIMLKKYALYDYIDDLDSKTPNNLKIIREDIEKKEKELDAQLAKLIALEEKVDPLQKLREQGKPLTMVYLRDGSQIAGSIISADEKTMLLDTGDGAIKLPVAEILRRLPMK